MKRWSRAFAALIAIAFLLQGAAGGRKCAASDYEQATAPMPMAPHQAGHHDASPGHSPLPHSCGPIDGAVCFTMSSCIATGAPTSATRFFVAPPVTAGPAAALVDAPALRDITPESPPPRA
jgi:hypothetical protein